MRGWGGAGPRKFFPRGGLVRPPARPRPWPGLESAPQRALHTRSRKPSLATTGPRIRHKAGHEPGGVGRWGQSALQPPPGPPGVCRGGASCCGSFLPRLTSGTPVASSAGRARTLPNRRPKSGGRQDWPPETRAGPQRGTPIDQTSPAQKGTPPQPKRERVRRHPAGPARVERPKPFLPHLTGPRPRGRQRGWGTPWGMVAVAR